MLEVKNLKKTYKTKKGVTTKALDDVSLTFAEKGMVFILGKSGSGKSTLLNVCGGLDKADSGEIVIKGKSSASFSGQDFDSYRNTYVGFVFQEYNILDEFTVEDNIALALELQNKKRDKEVIAKILEAVEMTEYANRKPNTLSGGQKQRVAIARALVKEPEIIMADEPTGALDSKTGQQVFDTLKRLSKEKLVLVISHDREFAEQYGDRIIELKDGKVISDMTRAETSEDDKNVRFYGTDTVCVTDGSKITDEDMRKIRKFLSDANGAAVISTSREKIGDFKRDRPEIDVGTFENIKEQPVSKEYPNQKLIRSKFPLKHAIKMGASGLKSKPVRLVFTMLLSVVAFVLFGLFSTIMLFDEQKVTVESLKSSNYTYINMSKGYHYTRNSYRNDKLTDSWSDVQSTNYTLEEYKALAAKYSGTLALFRNAGSGDISIANFEQSSNAGQYYAQRLQGFVIADNALNKLEGEMPERDDEIAISDFLFDSFKAGKFYGYTERINEYTHEKEYVKNDKALELTDYKSIIGQLISLDDYAGDYKLKIVGVYKASDIPDDYRDIKQAADDNAVYDGKNDETWSKERQDGFYAYAAATENFVKIYAGKHAQNSSQNTQRDKYFPYNYSSYNTQYEIVYSVNEPSDGNFMSSIHAIAEYKKTDKGDPLPLYDLAGNALTSLSTGQVAFQSREVARILAEILNRNNLPDIYNSEEYRQLNDEISNKENEKRNISIWEIAERITEYNNQIESCEGQITQKRTEADNWKAERDKYDPEKPDDKALYDEYNDKYQAALVELESLESALAFYTEQKAQAEAELSNLNSQIAALDKEIEQLSARRQKMEDDYNAYNQTLNNLREKLWSLNNWENEIEQDEAIAIIAEAYAYITENNFAMPQIKLKNPSTLDEGNVTIAGMYMVDRALENSYELGWYMSDDVYARFYVPPQGAQYRTEFVTKYDTENKDAFIAAVLVPYDKSDSLTRDLVKLTKTRGEDDSTVIINNALMHEINLVSDTAEGLATVFLWVGIVLALFAFLLMFNFISASITAKKKEIGILRAIGARTLDVFKVFLSEAYIIALICFVIATIGSAGVCYLLNWILMVDTALLSTSIFIFGPISVLCILAITVVTATVSTLLPVALYSRKPPVASIRAL